MVKILKIDRFAYTLGGTFGTLYLDGWACTTLENPWKNNEPYISCIPTGVYIIKRDTFKGQYENFKLVNVPGRSAIELHIGNTITDTNGCPLLGDKYRIDSITPDYHITDSRKTFREFMSKMVGIDEAVLIIKNYSLSVV